MVIKNRIASPIVPRGSLNRAGVVCVLCADRAGRRVISLDASSLSIQVPGIAHDIGK